MAVNARWRLGLVVAALVLALGSTQCGPQPTVIYIVEGPEASAPTEAGAGDAEEPDVRSSTPGATDGSVDGFPDGSEDGSKDGSPAAAPADGSPDTSTDGASDDRDGGGDESTPVKPSDAAPPSCIAGDTS